MNEYQTPSKTLDDILSKVLQMAWDVKGKHGLVSGLMMYLPVPYFLKKEPQLREHLLDCMSTNFLASSATRLFTSILRNADLTDNSIECEIMSWVRAGLLCRDCLQKRNVNHLWLPACIRFAPEMFQNLLKSTENSLYATKTKNKDPLLYMLTCLLKSARMHHVKFELPVEILREVLCHVDDELRLDGFALTCLTPKKSEPLSEVELHMLRGGLPYNMNNGNAPFRQQLQSHLRTLLVRGRDSLLTALNDSEKQQMVVRTLEFLDWLWRLCVDSLHPGSSYQRLKTCLDWIAVILDTLTYQPSKHQKKGNTPQNVVNLLEKAKERHLLKFHTDYVVRSLLSCLLHGTDEIRERAGEILPQLHAIAATRQGAFCII